MKVDYYPYLVKLEFESKLTNGDSEKVQKVVNQSMAHHVEFSSEGFDIYGFNFHEDMESFIREICSTDISTYPLFTILEFIVNFENMTSESNFYTDKKDDIEFYKQKGFKKKEFFKLRKAFGKNSTLADRFN